MCRCLPTQGTHAEKTHTKVSSFHSVLYVSYDTLNNGLLFFRSDMQFQCGQCSYATVEKSALEKHVRFKHTKERPFECEVCGFSTHTKSHMTRLVRRYSILRLAWSNLGISL